MKQIYEILKNMKSKITGDCEVSIKTPYNVCSGITISIKWSTWTENNIGTLEHYLSDTELNKYDNKKIINKFIKEANDFYHRRQTQQLYTLIK